MKSNTTKMKARANPIRLPACPVFLTVNGQDITAKLKESIRFHINGTNMRNHLQSTRVGWSDLVWDSRDFCGLSGALSSTPIMYQMRVSESIHVWLNTGHQHQKMESHAKSSCPVCSMDDETQKHILKFKGQKLQVAQFNALIKLRSAIVTKHGRQLCHMDGSALSYACHDGGFKDDTS